MSNTNCPACHGSGVISTSDAAGLVDQFPCDLCDDTCEHGIRAPHECKECADAPSDAEIADWMERRERDVRGLPGSAGCQHD